METSLEWGSLWAFLSSKGCLGIQHLGFRVSESSDRPFKRVRLYAEYMLKCSQNIYQPDLIVLRRVILPWRAGWWDMCLRFSTIWTASTTTSWMASTNAYVYRVWQQGINVLTSLVCNINIHHILTIKLLFLNNRVFNTVPNIQEFLVREVWIQKFVHNKSDI